MKSPLLKKLGDKGFELTPALQTEIVRVFITKEESEVSQFYRNEEFGYWAITVERPLRLHIYPERSIPEGALSPSELQTYKSAIAKLPKETPYDDWARFSKATGLKNALLKKVRPFITEKDPEAKAIDGEPDTDLRDTEIVPFIYDGGIDAFLKNEVHPYAPDAYIDEKKTQIGYEISFTKYFYKPSELRSLQTILADLQDLEAQTEGMMAAIIGGIQ